MEYESAPEYAADAYRIAGWAGGVAWSVYGWEVEPDEDTEWSGCMARTGNLVCVMIGDDRRFSIDPDDVHAIEDGAYCRECGQIGCGHGAYA